LNMGIGQSFFHHSHKHKQKLQLTWLDGSPTMVPPISFACPDASIFAWSMVTRDMQGPPSKLFNDPSWCSGQILLLLRLWVSEESYLQWCKVPTPWFGGAGAPPSNLPLPWILVAVVVSILPKGRQNLIGAQPCSMLIYVSKSVMPFIYISLFTSHSKNSSVHRGEYLTPCVWENGLEPPLTLLRKTVILEMSSSTWRRNGLSLQLTYVITVPLGEMKYLTLGGPCAWPILCIKTLAPH
jgi:hypothetical protein